MEYDREEGEREEGGTAGACSGEEELREVELRERRKAEWGVERGYLATTSVMMVLAMACSKANCKASARHSALGVE